jgi:hypothetical protein
MIRTADMMGKEDQVNLTFDFHQIYQPDQQPEDLTVQITEQELISVILEWPHSKAPGPADGFPGEFYQTFKDILILNLMAVYNEMTMHPHETLHLLSSYIIIIPKKEAPIKPQDFRLISVIKGIQKIYLRF